MRIVGTRRLAWLLVVACGFAAGCANSRPIYVPRPRFDPARPERIGRSRSPLLPPIFRRRSEPIEIRVDPPVIEGEPGVRFEPSGEQDPPLVIEPNIEEPEG